MWYQGCTWSTIHGIHVGQDDGLEEHEADGGVDRALDRAAPERDHEHDPDQAELGHEVRVDVVRRAEVRVRDQQSAAEARDRRRQRERDDPRAGSG